jgi:hypothetical protein
MRGPDHISGGARGKEFGEVTVDHKSARSAGRVDRSAPGYTVGASTEGPGVQLFGLNRSSQSPSEGTTLFEVEAGTGEPVVKLGSDQGPARLEIGSARIEFHPARKQKPT